jgi:thiamine biosynthesis lipoprotein
VADPSAVAVADLTVPVTVGLRSMGSFVSIQTASGDRDSQQVREALTAALDTFADVDRSCTRFTTQSPLMRANTAGDAWCEVGATCFDVLLAAYHAYRDTAGRFDPRVHDDLVRLGYDRSMTAGGISPRDAGALAARPPMGRWRPQFRPDSHRVRIGEHPVDLGGIGKGLAVMRAARQLDRIGLGYLIDAGGDCWCRGHSPDGPWRLGVEDPLGATEPVAVLAVADAGIATSSKRLGRWRIGGTEVHHLIDPKTGQPGGAGLAAVTVVAADTATAEVWSKVLFLEGIDQIAAAAQRHEIAALWIDDSGRLAATAEMATYLVWQAR